MSTEIREKMREVRKKSGLSTPQFARVLGYKGTDASMKVIISRFENGHVAPTKTMTRLILMFDAYGIPKEWTNDSDASGTH